MAFQKKSAVLTPDFVDAFKKFLDGAQTIVDKGMESFPSLPKITLTYNIGGRYIKIIRDSSVYCFVDTTNRDVLKAASYKLPAKHARGNIFDSSNGVDAVGTYGANYLR